MRKLRGSSRVAFLAFLTVLSGQPMLADSEPVFVAWPGSVRLLDVALGDAGRAARSDFDLCAGLYRVPDSRAFAFLDGLESGERFALRQSLAMQSYASAAMDPRTPDDERARLDARFRQRVEHLQRLATETEVDGVKIFAGFSAVGEPNAICFESIQLVARLPNYALAHVFEHLDLTTAENAWRLGSWIRWFPAGVQQQIRSLRMVARTLEAGPGNGGLREQWRLLLRAKLLAIEAANGTLAAGARAALDAEFQRLLGRFEEIASVARYRGIPLLGGGPAVDLDVAPRGRTVLAYPEIDTTLTELALENVSIKTDLGAQLALGSLSAAAARLLSDIETLEALRREMKGRPRHGEPAVDRRDPPGVVHRRR